MPDPNEAAPSAEVEAEAEARSRIRARRIELGMSRQELSHRTDVSLSTIRRWEVNDPRGRNPHLRDVLRVAAALDTTVDAILEDWWQPPPPPNRPSVFWEIRGGGGS